MNLFNRSRNVFLFLSVMLLSACGGGGGSDAPAPPANNAPTANAGADQTVDELSAVSLGGSGTDADGDTLTYAWTQTAGPAATITNANMAQASFTAPDVLATATPVSLTFRLAVSDGTATTNDTLDVSVADIGVGANSPPVSNAGPDQAVAELITVNLNGTSSSDPNGDTLTFAWLQTSGPVVVLSDAAAAQPTFTSPDVTAGTPQTLIFQLTVDDGTDNTADTMNIVVSEPAAVVSVAGVVSYEFVNPNLNPNPNLSCRGLNFGDIDVRPIRAATVQLVDSGGTVLDTTIAADDGSYSFVDVVGSSDVRIQVRAELQRTGTPAWDVEVRDNVDTSATPPPLNTRPIYVVQFPIFNVGGSDNIGRDFTAVTGWDTSLTPPAYGPNRAAAPFAILDAIYSGMQLILTVDANANFAPLDAFWSANNALTSPTNIDLGELSSSFYNGGIDSLFLLGDANTDTEEFDDHVTMHEWGHYFEDNFSRSDSIGGPHGIGQSIDPRLAFGEGWATALAAMALNNPQYCDTGVVGTSSGFGIDTEGNNSGPQGFYNEMSVATLIYDLWDTNVDGTDTSSIGFGPIFDTMIGPQSNTDAFTTLFSFGESIRTFVAGADLAFVDSQLMRENVDLGSLDRFASGQSVQPVGARDVLPVYTTLVPDGTTLGNICTNSDFDTRVDTDGDLRREGNKLSEYRYLRIVVSNPTIYDVVITTLSPPPPTADTMDNDQSDPDIRIFSNGLQIVSGLSGVANSEEFFTPALAVGTYVAALREFRFADGAGTPQNYPTQSCFDITMTPR